MQLIINPTRCTHCPQPITAPPWTCGPAAAAAAAEALVAMGTARHASGASGTQVPAAGNRVEREERGNQEEGGARSAVLTQGTEA